MQHLKRAPSQQGFWFPQAKLVAFLDKVATSLLRWEWGPMQIFEFTPRMINQSIYLQMKSLCRWCIPHSLVPVHISIQLLMPFIIPFCWFCYYVFWLKCSCFALSIWLGLTQISGTNSVAKEALIEIASRLRERTLRSSTNPVPHGSFHRGADFDDFDSRVIPSSTMVRPRNTSSYRLPKVRVDTLLLND